MDGCDWKGSPQTYPGTPIDQFWGGARFLAPKKVAPLPRERVRLAWASVEFSLYVSRVPFCLHRGFKISGFRVLRYGYQFCFSQVFRVLQ